MWTYRGINVYPANVNSAGIRWYAMTGNGLTLRADTKQSMRELIRFELQRAMECRLARFA